MLSVIIITKNEEEMIGDCLKSVGFADEIILVDTGNTDDTNKIAKNYKAKVVRSIGGDYSQFRNVCLEAARGDWVLYVDADERVTPELKSEVLQITKQEKDIGAYAVPRKNIFLGKYLKHGGWGNDYVIRFFRKVNLTGYTNPLHEQPVFSGELGKLQSGFVHISHRNLESMLEKTLEFTAYEAELRLKAGHPQMSWWRFLRVMVTEFWLRFIKLSAWRDGTEGIIDGIFQVFNTFIIYTRVWEKQHESRSL